MYHGVYEGAAAEAQEKKILILGESHHDLDSSITTQEVVEDYLSPENTTKQSLQFFHKIALAFGVDTGKVEEKARLWDKVFFGNYINKSLDGPSGEGDETAQTLIAANRDRWKGRLHMNTDLKAHVLHLLETYPKRKRQIDALYYELTHPAQVSPAEQLEAMNYAHSNADGKPGVGHVSNKTLLTSL